MRTIGLITEVFILIFTLLIFSRVTILYKNHLSTYLILFGTSAISIGAFCFVVYHRILSESAASCICVSVPMMLIFFLLSKYKDFRFFVTFGVIDTLTLILTFLTRCIHAQGVFVFSILASVIACLVMLFLYFFGTKFFLHYRDLMINVQTGWGTMALAILMIYFLLIVAAAYPSPLLERPEYFPVYLLLSLTVISFYTVFVLSLHQRKQVNDLNLQLENEKKWHGIAYKDALTGMGNRMAYMERISEIERSAAKTEEAFAVMIDLNSFKKINDTYGHHFGDIILKKIADVILETFSSTSCECFRIGGDEFAVIARNLSEEDLNRLIEALRDPTVHEQVGCSLSIGYAKANFAQYNALETAFILADSAMYDFKSRQQS